MIAANLIHEFPLSLDGLMKKLKLPAEALDAYLDVNEWQVAGVKRALVSLDRVEGVPHREVKDWVNSWGKKRERPAPKQSSA
jgi:predicted transcriptional regulator